MKRIINSNLLFILLALSLSLSIAAPALAYFNTNEEGALTAPVYDYLPAETTRYFNGFEGFPDSVYISAHYMGYIYGGYIQISTVNIFPTIGLVEVTYKGMIPLKGQPHSLRLSLRT